MFMRDSELILTDDGSIYHLHLQPGQVAKKVLLVGDPDRVERIAQELDQVELRCHKREFYTLTGWTQGQKISIISTGIGTDNVDIVLSELDALFNIDFETRAIKEEVTELKILRLGTCGGMQPTVPVGSLVASNWAIGGDGLMPFYSISASPLEQDFAHTWQIYQQQRLPGALSFYTTACAPELDELIRTEFPEIQQGITYTAAGFYGPQGRSLGRIPVRFPDLPEILSGFQYEGQQVLNMEMEASGVLAMAKGLGHQAGCICIILANRQLGQFAEDPAAEEQKLIQTGLEVIRRW